MARFTALLHSRVSFKIGSPVRVARVSSAGLPNGCPEAIQASRVGISGIFTPRRIASGQSHSSSKVFVSAGKRLTPRHFEYRFTNSAAARAYFEIAWSFQYLMMFGMKHSLCLISMVSKTQPSESMPTKNLWRGLKARSFSGEESLIVQEAGHCRRASRHPFGVGPVPNSAS